MVELFWKGVDIMFVVLAKPVDQAFVLNPEKAEEFLARKGDPKIKEMHLRRAKEFRKNMTKDDRSKNEIR